MRAVELAAQIAYQANIENSVEIITPGQLDSVAWEEIGLVVWQSTLPKPEDAAALESFVAGNGWVLFMPPRAPKSEKSFGFSWTAWKPVAEDIKITTWRGDADLLANTQNGMALPVGELSLSNVCGIDGDLVPLASLSDDTPVLVKVPTDHGGVYALATTATNENSTLASNGVVLYVVIQRALLSGSARLADVRQEVAGSGDFNSAEWERMAGAEAAISSQYQFHSGVFQAGDRLMAFNRAEMEDSEAVLTDEQVSTLFGELDLVKIEDKAGAASSLIREIWRLFVILMLVAMVAEALLCLPRKNSEAALAAKGATA